MRISGALTALLCSTLLGGCMIIDIKPHDDGGVRSDAFISGFADAGWPEDDSIVAVGLFEGRSDGTLLMFQLWKLVRFELGFIGASAGVGPLDAGIGIFFYDPEPPRYERWDDWEDDHDD